MRIVSVVSASLVALGAGCGSSAAVHQARPPAPSRTSTVDGISYRAVTAVLSTAPLRFRTTVVASNADRHPRRASLPSDCPVLIRAYQGHGMLGGPVWDQAKQATCPDGAVQFTLEPGETREFHSEATGDEVLGRLLPAGRYTITAVVRPGGRAVELAAGDVMLTRSRISLHGRRNP